jgi:hypothetical protein
VSNRDTQFVGFAEALFNELMDRDDFCMDNERPGWEDEWKLRIARRAYDFACHVVRERVWDIYDTRIEFNVNEYISDMPVLPEVKDE